MNNRKIARFYMLLGKLHIKEQKDAILSGYGVESTKDLTQDQLDEVILALQNKLDEKQTIVSAHTRKLRSQVISLLTKLGKYKDGEGWERTNAYLMQNRIAGKLMYEMTDAELLKLISKLRAIHKKQEEKIQEENFWASHN